MARLMHNEFERVQKDAVVPNLMDRSGTCLERLNKTVETPSQGGRFPGRDLSQGPPECEAISVITSEV
jgi:hypothetical protein